jgi:hypothetical protein
LGIQAEGFLLASVLKGNNSIISGNTTFSNGTVTILNGTIVTDSPGNGGIRILGGSTNNLGFIEFRSANTAAQRQGYIGYGQTANTIDIAGERGAFNFLGLPPTISGNPILSTTSACIAAAGGNSGNPNLAGAEQILLSTTFTCTRPNMLFLSSGRVFNGGGATDVQWFMRVFDVTANTALIGLVSGISSAVANYGATGVFAKSLTINNIPVGHQLNVQLNGFKSPDNNAAVAPYDLRIDAVSIG